MKFRPFVVPFCAILVGVSISLLAAACTGGVTPTPINPSPIPTATVSIPAPTETRMGCSTTRWSVDFTRSGGIAGRTQSLHVDSDGTVSASEPARDLSAQSSLSPQEVADLGRLLQAACPFQSATKSVTCPDCFNYTLEIQLGGRSYPVRASDVDRAGLGDLIQALNQLLGKSFSG
jgi:hypothetical protein